MLYREVQEVYECLDRPDGATSLVGDLFLRDGDEREIDFETRHIEGDNGETDFVRIRIPGNNGKRSGGRARTLGVIGRLGGVGARPVIKGFVSDGDGALAALSVALKLARMHRRGDSLEGDVVVATHICTHAPVLPKNSPMIKNTVAFMDSPVELSVMNDFEVSGEMDAILRIDTSRGTKLVNTSGCAITPTVIQGWILRVSVDLLNLMEITTGRLATVFPITMQDITPYGNKVYHFNSLMQPAIATDAPLVGIALTSAAQVPGCATGITTAHHIEEVGRFVVECAQRFGTDTLQFYDPEELSILQGLYGDMRILQTIPDR